MLNANVLVSGEVGIGGDEQCGCRQVSEVVAVIYADFLLDVTQARPVAKNGLDEAQSQTSIR